MPQPNPSEAVLRQLNLQRAQEQLAAQENPEPGAWQQLWKQLQGPNGMISVANTLAEGTVKAGVGLGKGIYTVGQETLQGLGNMLGNSELKLRAARESGQIDAARHAQLLQRSREEAGKAINHLLFGVPSTFLDYKQKRLGELGVPAQENWTKRTLDNVIPAAQTISRTAGLTGAWEVLRGRTEEGAPIALEDMPAAALDAVLRVGTIGAPLLRPLGNRAARNIKNEVLAREYDASMITTSGDLKPPSQNPTALKYQNVQPGTAPVELPKYERIAVSAAEDLAFEKAFAELYSPHGAPGGRVNEILEVAVKRGLDDPNRIATLAGELGVPVTDVAMAWPDTMTLTAGLAGRFNEVLSRIANKQMDKLYYEATTLQNPAALQTYNAIVRRRAPVEGAWAKFMDWYNQADRARLGLMVAAPPTAFRNFVSQSGITTLSLLDHAFSQMPGKTINKGLGDALSGAAQEALSMMEMVDIALPKAMKPSILGRAGEAFRDLIDEIPTIHRQMYGDYGQGQAVASLVSQRAIQSWTAGALQKAGLSEAIVGTLEAYAYHANFLNRWQEYLFREMNGKVRLEQNLRLAGYEPQARAQGMTLLEYAKQMAENPDAPASFKYALQDATDYAMANTLSRTPRGKLKFRSTGASGVVPEGTPVETFNEFGRAPLELYHTLSKYIPMSVLSPTPFPRFMVNSLRYMGEHSPTNFLNLFSKEYQSLLKGDAGVWAQREAQELLGKATTGTALMMFGFAAHQGAFKEAGLETGPKWYQYRLPGDDNNKWRDARALAPLAQQALLAGAMINAALTGGRLNLDATETAEAISGFKNIASNYSLNLVNSIKRLDAKDPESQSAVMLSLVGDWAGSFFTPLKSYLNLGAQIATGDPKYNTQRDLQGNELLGPTQEALQSVIPQSQLPPPMVNMYTNRELAAPNDYFGRPIMTLFGFPANETSPLQDMINSLGLKPAEFLPQAHNAATTQAAARAMANFLKIPMGTDAAGKPQTFDQWIVNILPSAVSGKENQARELRNIMNSLRRAAVTYATNTPIPGLPQDANALEALLEKSGADLGSLRYILRNQLRQQNPTLRGR